MLLALMVAVLILPSAAAAQDSEGLAQDAELDVSESEEPTIELQSGEEAVADQLIVKFKDEVSSAAQQDARSDEGLEKKQDLDLIDAEVDKVEGQSVEEAISALEERPEVAYVEPDHILQPDGYSDEPQFGELWGLHNTGQTIRDSNGTSDVDVNAPEASTVTQGEDQIVAVIDDGADFSHPDLRGREWTNPGESGGGKEVNGVDDDGNGKVDDVNGWDFANNDNTVHDAHDYHGTHVSGTIAASVNGEGVAGVAPKAKIMAVKFLGPRGGATSNAVLGLGYAKNMGAKLSNNSWGGGADNKALKEAIDASGMLFVASAGNSGTNNDTAPSYPASYDSSNVLSVAAIDNQGKLASFSNYGATSVDISAPGVSVLSSLPQLPDLPAVALSSVRTGQAVTTGFGADEIGDSTKRASFFTKAFAAVNRGSQQVVLVDDDASGVDNDENGKGRSGEKDVGETLRTAIESATGTAPEVIKVPYGRPNSTNPTGNGPSLSKLSGKTVVWATGQASFSADNGTFFTQPALTTTDQVTLRDFLNAGGKLVLTGMDALRFIEGSNFVTGRLGLKVQSDINRLRAFNGSSNTAFDGESYDLNSPTANSDLHDVLTPAAGSTAVTQGVYPGRGPWEYLNGTSMAAPHATGAAALAAAINPALLNDPVALKKAVMDGGKEAAATDGKTVTGDMVDARKALTRADTTKPQLKLPSDITAEATGPDGADVTYTASASDLVDGAVGVTCDPDSGSTFGLGTTTVNCSATDAAGNKATGSFKVKVAYDFNGFFSPVDNEQTLNRVRAGSAVPVKFTLGGNMGLDVFYKTSDGSSYPKSTRIACDSADPVDNIEETVSASSSGLSYDETTGQYTYVWKTSKSWAGTCRQLVVKLNDGKEYRTSFRFPS